ncbi:hypothetical protein ACJIZ3_006884 [Penstemon smallii]|uniref:Uncharacterized protein n=1 Tax=Penstemon smallii TaxID=265156 RepID=A0ABD3S915_9LAMI
MGRSPCCDKNGLKKGPWTTEEDTKLIQYVQANGPGNWRSLPKNAGLQRCGKSCRLRWTNYLRPDIKRGRFSFEEEETIIQLHSALGNKWSAIAARLPGRTDNEIKNYWNTHIRKRLLRMGIDPVTHTRRLDLLDLSSLINNNSPQLNLSNLIRLQTLLNPDALRLALSLSSLNNNNNQNTEVLLQNLQENQLLNNSHQLQNHHQAPFIQPNQFENIINQQIPSNLTTSLIQNQMQGNMGHYSANFQENSLTPTTTTTTTTFPSYCYDQMKGDFSENSSFQSMNNSFDSVLSTPMSSPPPLNSASALLNGSTEDERNSFCSDLFKFEIPESLNFDDFM